MLKVVSTEQSMNKYKNVKWELTLKWEYAQPESKQETNTSSLLQSTSHVESLSIYFQA